MTAQTAAPLIQGQSAPDVVVNPPLFYAKTRRQRFVMSPKVKANIAGGADSVQLKQTGIVAGLEIRVSGSVVFGGTIGTTTPSYNWPHLVKSFKLGANGQSTLLSARALTMRALEFCSNTDLNDRGISKGFGASTATNGTLALACDDWGTSTSNNVAPGVNVPAIGTYTYDVTYFLPVAADQVSLIASVFAQSSATNLTLDTAYYSQAELFSAVGGSATVDFSGINIDVTGVVYSIPQVDGKFVIPDLTQFHGVSETFRQDLGQGLNEPPLQGVGAGRKLLRILHNVYSSAAPLPVTDANYNGLGWAYGGNTVPEVFSGGAKLRALNERQTGVDLGRWWGFALHDFAGQYALRDIVDLGEAANIRTQIGLVNAPTTPQAYLTIETLFAGTVGA